MCPVEQLIRHCLAGPDPHAASVQCATCLNLAVPHSMYMQPSSGLKLPMGQQGRFQDHFIYTQHMYKTVLQAWQALCVSLILLTNTLRGHRPQQHERHTMTKKRCVLETPINSQPAPTATILRQLQVCHSHSAPCDSHDSTRSPPAESAWPTLPAAPSKQTTSTTIKC
jgi:hypothetical protein